ASLLLGSGDSRAKKPDMASETTVEANDGMSGVHRVYNLEINSAHTYLVSRKHILVHNDCPKPIPRIGRDQYARLTDGLFNDLVDRARWDLSKGIPGEEGKSSFLIVRDPVTGQFSALAGGSHGSIPIPRGADIIAAGEIEHGVATNRSGTY